MKQWEVIKELTEDPTKVFTDGQGSYLKFIDEGLLSWHSLTDEFCGLYTFQGDDATNWQLVRQPVTWQEAIQEFAKGKKLVVNFNNQEWTLGALVELPQYLDRAITNGKWYVE